MSAKAQHVTKKTPSKVKNANRGPAPSCRKGGPRSRKPVGGGSIVFGGGFISFGKGPSGRTIGLGYQPDLGDCRDLGVENLVEKLVKRRNLKGKAKLEVEGSFDLASSAPAFPSYFHLDDHLYSPPIENQGRLNSCTANAVVSCAEYLYLNRRNSEIPTHLDLSRLFLYKASRNLLGWSDDAGCYLRTAIKALRLFGTPPESTWPYLEDNVNVEPEAYHYSLARNFKALEYFRLDSAGVDYRDDLLNRIKGVLNNKLPIAFGFMTYSSFEDMGDDFVIPIPNRTKFDSLVGGHAVTLVGYDDNIEVEVGSAQNAANDGSRGAFIIRNSWGPQWGDHGYAYLPYYYIWNDLAWDFWTICDDNWLDLAAFE